MKRLLLVRKIITSSVPYLHVTTRRLIVTCMVVLCSVAGMAQSPSVPEDSNYIKTVNERAGKIVATLQINEEVKFKKVQNMVAQQYRSLNQVHETSKLTVAGIKQTAALSKEAQAEAIKKEEDIKMSKLKQQHDAFIAQLKTTLTDTQVEQVKDGMTYRVLPITYTAYQEMIPTLSEAQKQQIYTWLLEARDYAMDAESSDKKHAWFGKYKGRINNYLSAAGYDLKKEEEGWAARRKAKAASN
jgi:hypothetical protein